MKLKNEGTLLDSPLKCSRGGKQGSREGGVADETALLAAESLRSCGVSTLVGCLPESVQCPVTAFRQCLDHLQPATKQFLVSPDGGSLGGDGVMQLALVCWVSHGQFVLSGLKVRPRCRLCRSNNVYYSNRAGKRQVKAGRGR